MAIRGIDLCLTRAIFAAGGAMLLGLSGCASADAPLASAAEVNRGLADGYQLGAGDRLRVTVFDEPELTGEYRLGVGGDLSLPLIQAIPAAGVSPAALARKIETNLKEGGYVLAPRVSVEVLDHRPFYILGEVNTPGEYPYTGEISIQQAIAKAGGYTARANKKTIVLRRQEWSASKRIRLDDELLKIAPGDTIMVQEAFF